MKPTISVIVPVYNSEEYLRECLDCILNQTFKDYELILVDDGSNDGSAKICDEYANKDDRIIVIHQENQGVSVARNNALDIARGDYISFVDSDDILLTKDYFKILYDNLKKYDADHSICKVKYIKDDSRVLVGEDETLCITGQHLLSDLNIGSLNPYLINRKHFENVRFPQGRIVEDNAIIYNIFSDTDKIAATKLAMYGYRSRNNSQSGKANAHNLYIGTYYGFDERIKYYEEHGLIEKAEGFRKWRNKQLTKYFLQSIKNNTVDLIPKEIHLPLDEMIEYLQNDDEE